MKYQSEPTKKRSKFTSRTNIYSDGCFFGDIYIFSIRIDQIFQNFRSKYPFFSSSNPKLEEAYRNWSLRDNIVRDGQTFREYELQAWTNYREVNEAFSTKKEEPKKDESTNLLCQSFLFLFLPSITVSSSSYL